MTPTQALQNLYNAASQAKFTAAEHQTIAESAKLLADTINPKEEPKKK